MITMHSISEKNLSEAYTLLAVISDPKGCKEGWDGLYKAVQEAKTTQEIAVREKAVSEHLLREAERVKADADAWALRIRDQKSKLDEREKDLVEREQQLIIDTRFAETGLQTSLANIESKQKQVSIMEREVGEREGKLAKEQEGVLSMKKEYEEKIKRLKSML